MKRIIISVLFFLFIASSVTTYAQLFKEHEASITETSNSNSEENNSNAGFFRAGAPGPGNRPENSEGIGQETPLGDGLSVMVVCCVLFGLVKIYNGKKKK